MNLEVEDVKSMTIKELCKKYGTSRSTIYKHCQNLGVKPLKKTQIFSEDRRSRIGGRSKKSLTEAQKKHIKDNINIISQNQIAKDLGITQHLVRVAIGEMGLQIDQDSIQEFKSEGARKGLRKALKNSIKNWEDPEFRIKMGSLISERNKRLNKDASYKKKLSKASKKMWEDEEHRKRMQNLFLDDDYRSKISEGNIKRWRDPEYRRKHEELWSDPSWLEKVNIRTTGVSLLQTQLYSILNDLNIPHHEESDSPETTIGPYHFDCVVPVGNKKLLIECQGDYWHSLKKNIRNDKAKATYIEKYHKDCEIKYLWEHEFKCKDKIIELIKYWTGKTNFDLVNFQFNDVEIKKCQAKDYKLLLSKYHYLPNAGRGGIAYGSYLGNELIAVCVFSPLGRQNIPFDKKSTRELSRLCINPRYQKKNFASWFVSRCIKKLDSKYKTIISYCDTTFNHNGATYKACNFKLDNTVKPDYWYVSEDGWVMHKKTLYNHAKKMSMKEKEYAELNSYKKIYGKEKLRFVFERIS